MKEKLKLVENIAPPIDPTLAARENLRQAIKYASSIKSELAAADDAAMKAKLARYAAEDRLEALNSKKDKVDPGALFMAALASGQTPTATDLVPENIEEEKRKIEREIAVWKDAQISCEKVANELRSSFMLADMTVNRRADDVLKCLDVVDRIIDGAEAMQAELVRQRVLLRFFEHRGLIADEAMYRRVRNFLDDRDLPMRYGAIEGQKFDLHEISMKWAAVRETLKSDSNAQFPTD